MTDLIGNPGFLTSRLILDDKKVQDAMTQALVDVNKKMVTQLKKQKKDLTRSHSPQVE